MEEKMNLFTFCHNEMIKKKLISSFALSFPHKNHQHGVKDKIVRVEIV